jgi:N-acetyl-anhydromuramyl-L-alanine amidase AmpD
MLLGAWDFSHVPFILFKGDVYMDKPNIIDIREANKSQVPAMAGNSHEFIIIHYLGVKNADNPYLYNNGYGGHFNITRDGKIYQAANPECVLWHIGNPGCYTEKYPNGWNPTNQNAIGIENSVCYDTDWYFTKETEESLVTLTKWLMQELNIDSDHVLRHFDVLNKCCPAPYVANNKHNGNMTWDEFKARISSDDSYAYTFNVNQISTGSNGKTVKLLQTLLKGRGYNLTILAVKDFQKTSGLTSDGIVGNNTWTKLIPCYSDTVSNIERKFCLNEIEYGSTGAECYFVQNLLKGLGYYNKAIDTSFGDGCKKAIIKYQKDNGMSGDGYVGKNTYTRLIGF